MIGDRPLNVEILTSERATLGEGPLWHLADRALYWVDIHGQKVFKYEPESGENQVVHTGHMVTALSELDRGGLMLVTPEGLFALQAGGTEVLTGLTLPEGVRTNDGKCGPDGRLWFGTMDTTATRPIGELFSFDGSSVRSVQQDVILSNGIGWSPEGDVFYHVDSIRRLLYRHMYDVSHGVISEQTVLVDMTDQEEVPDGLAVDSSGNIWVAMYDGWRIDVYDSAGERIDRVDLDVQKPTCVAFGGEGLAELYVTTASEHLGADELAQQPHAGRLLRLDPGTTGCPVGSFLGR